MPAQDTGVLDQLLAALASVAGLGAIFVLKQVVVPWLKEKISGGAPAILEGHGEEIVLHNEPSFSDRDNGTGFKFTINEARATRSSGRVKIEMDMVNHHLDGQDVPASCVAEGIVVGNFAFVIYTTEEKAPARGKWTGCGVLRMSSAGESLGAWITEDIYEPGRYMMGMSKFWPKGTVPRMPAPTPTPTPT